VNFSTRNGEFAMSEKNAIMAYSLKNQREEETGPAEDHIAGASNMILPMRTSHRVTRVGSRACLSNHIDGQHFQVLFA
jgi:hypothetical protein